MPSTEEHPSVEENPGDVSESATNKEYFRIVVMGAAKVGKTALIQQFLYSHYLVDYKATVEDLYTVDYETNNSNVKVEILDTSGAYQFPAMRRLAIEKADAFVLVCAVDDEFSFDEVALLRTQIRASRPSTIPVTIVCNKYDLIDEGRCLTSRNEAIVSLEWQEPYCKCSAKNDQNVVNVFINLLNCSKIYCSYKIVEEKRRKSLPVYLYKSKQDEHKMALQRHSCTIS
ncbi:Uncharacterised protein g6028 [Pycnogonum litorale]